jgi:YMGG-like Gly-zipper
MKSRQRFWDLGLKKQVLILGLLGLSFLIGCSTTNTVPSPYLLTGAGLGTALGAGIGAAVNHNNPWKGAAIGGLLGAAGGGVAGGLYGQSQNQYQPQSQGAYQPPQQGYYQQQQPQQQGNYQPAPYYGPPPS